MQNRLGFKGFHQLTVAASARIHYKYAQAWDVKQDHKKRNAPH